MIVYIFRYFFGNKNFYYFYKFLYKLALKGLNVGMNKNPNYSGEKYVLEQLKNQVEKDPENLVIFDVGANKGDYSILVNDIFNSTSQIYTFEPSPSVYQILSERTSNIENINLFNIGFSDKQRTEKLYTSINSTSLASLYKRNLNHYNIELDNIEVIYLEELDLFCQRMLIEKINFLKIDVEGHELQVLKGSERMINERRIENIQFEFGGCNIDSRTYFQDFFYYLKDKYDIYRILRNGLVKVESYDESLEIFIHTNYLAKLKLY
jgi:FkbM family methyltransferase